MEYERNRVILNELRIEGIFDRILKHKSSWIQHVDRLQRDFRNYQEIRVSAYPQCNYSTILSATGNVQNTDFKKS
jgi:hypothetical protein